MPQPQRATRRAIAATPAAIGAGVALAACGVRTGSPPQPAQSAQPVKIILATDWNSPPRLAVMNQMQQEFERAHPNVSVTLDIFTSTAANAGASAGPYSEKVIAQLVANTPPDVIANFAPLPFVDQMADLTKDAPAAGWKKADMVYDPFNQEINGKLYMLSMSASVSGWVYNKSLFQENGIKDPDDRWTLDDILEAAGKLTKPDKKQYGVLAVEGLWFSTLEMFWSAGAGSTGPTSAEMFDPVKKKSRLTEAGGPEVWQWYIDLIHKHRVSPSPAQARAEMVAFNNGNVGMRPYGVYNSGGDAQRIGSNFVWSAMPMPLNPTTKKRSYDLNSEGFIIPKTTKQKGTFDTALRYALSFYSDPVMKMVAEQRGTLPVVRKWVDSKEYLAPPPLNLDTIVKTMNDRQIIVGDHGQRHKAFPQWTQSVRAELVKALEGEAAAKPNLQAAMDIGDRILNAS